MDSGKFNRLWLGITILLAVIIIAGGFIIWLKTAGNQPVEISILTENETYVGEIFIDGAITSPGIYPLRSGDRIEDIIKAAGGPTTNTNPTRLELYLSDTGKSEQPQKIDINRAEAWLLQALPGIGEARANAIIEYRQKNGLFRNTSEMSRVEGIGDTIYENIKDLITVGE